MKMMIIGIVAAISSVAALLSTISIITNRLITPFTAAQPQQQQQPQTNATITTSSTIPPLTNNKTLYLFTAEHDGVNQTKLGIPPDTFSPNVLEVNNGDNVTIHFYNLDTTDSHTFTIGVPYNIDKVVTPGQNATFTFKAADQGIYRFYCRFHQPTMTGQLVVLAPPIVEKPTTTAAPANTTR